MPDEADLPVMKRSVPERERLVETIARKMDKPVTALGVLFLLLVLTDVTVPADAAARPYLNVASWAIWAVFVAEFVIRLVVAPSKRRFLQRNWWQVIFLAVPFLRFLRAAGRVARLRPARVGRVVASSVRGTRISTRKLSSRLSWLTALTGIVILASSQLLFEFGAFESYTRALHAAAFTTIAGQPIDDPSGVADVLELVLALYSVVVFAFLAGTLGAFLLERNQERDAPRASEAVTEPA